MNERSPQLSCARRSTGVLVVALVLGLEAGAPGQSGDVNEDALASLIESLAETWRWRSFDTAEGLPSNSIHALYQDREQFIYAATDRGICRYNFWKWKPVKTAGVFVPGDRVRFVEAAGVLYVATETSLWREQGGELVQAGVGGSLFAAADSGGAHVLDATTGRYLRIRGSSSKPATDASVALPQDASVLDYNIDTTDVHWLATSEGLFWRRVGGWRTAPPRYFSRELDGYHCVRLFSVARPVLSDSDREEPGTEDRLWGLFQSGSGAAHTSKLARLGEDFWSVGGEAPRESQCPGQEDFLVESVVMDGQGSFLAATEEGRLVVSSDGCEWTEVRSLGPGGVGFHGAIVDTSGAIWWRQGTGGIALFDAPSKRWETIPAGEGRSRADVLSLLQTRNGDIWSGFSDGLSQYDGERTKFHRDSVGTELRQITGLEEDAGGRVWVSSSTAFGGALVFDQEHRAKPGVPGFSDYPIARIVRDVRDPRAAGWDLWFLSREPRTPQQQQDHVLYRLSREQARSDQDLEPIEVHAETGPINDLLYSKDEKYWLATDAGLVRAVFQERELRFGIERVFTHDDGLLAPGVLSIGEGPDGAIWACHWYAGVTRVRGDEVTSFTEENGLASADIRSVAQVGQSLWFGTGEGLSRYSEDCWFHQPVMGRVGVARIVRAAVDRAEGLLVGTFGQGALRYQPQLGGRPRFTERYFPEEALLGEPVEFRWEARDKRNDTNPEDLLYRFRIDAQAWSSFGPTRHYVAEHLGAGSHSFEVEVRDRDGNGNRGRDVYQVLIGSAPAASSSRWAVLLMVTGTGLTCVLLTLFIVARVRRLRRSRRHGVLYRHFPSPVFLLEADGRVTDYNGVFPELVGLEGVRLGDILGRPIALLPLFADQEVTTNIASLWDGEEFVLTKALGEYQVELSGFPAHDGAGGVQSGMVIVRDRTERTALRRYRERERRLSSLRSLADQVALVLRRHLKDLRDWRGELLPHVPEGERDRHEGRLDARVETLEKLSRSLAVFSGAIDAGPVDTIAAAEIIDEVARRSLEEAERSLATSPGNLRLDSRVQTGLWPVRARLESFADALGEILRNAWEAISAGGTVVVRASNLRLEDDDGPGALPAGHYVDIVIQDNGVGISETQIDHVFDPFFSTRSRGGVRDSVGVGLSLAYGVVRSHGGDLRIESRPGKGTTVRVIWPAAL